MYIYKYVCMHATLPVQVRAVQTQFPQAHTHLLHSIRVSAPSSKTSSSRAHSTRTEQEEGAGQQAGSVSQSIYMHQMQLEEKPCFVCGITSLVGVIGGRQAVDELRQTQLPVCVFV